MRFLKWILRLLGVVLIKVGGAILKRVAQEFSELVDTYAIDPKTGELVKTGQENRQKLINSAAKNSYAELMAAQQNAEALGSVNYVTDSEIQVNNFYGDFLDIEDYADSLREKYKLPEDMSIQEIFNFLETAAKKEEKEVLGDEEKVIPQGEPEELQEVSPQNEE